MAGNPLTSQGTLNRLRVSVTFPDNPEFNITPSFLGKAGVNLAFDGAFTTQIDTMTGAVQSPEPYVPVTMTISLLKTQALANQFKSRAETNTLLGDCTVRGDASTLAVYQLTNCAIDSGPPDLSFAGASADFMVRIKGYYNLNDGLWNS